MTKTYPSLAALKIAGLTRQKFKDLLRHGYLPFVPATTKGKDRRFGADDICALVAFTVFHEMGIRSDIAVEAAIWALESVRQIDRRKGPPKPGEIVWHRDLPLGHLVMPLLGVVEKVDGALDAFDRVHLAQMTEAAEIAARGEEIGQ